MANHQHNHNLENDYRHLYEGDQSKLYSGVMLAHHTDINSSESKTQVKRIWKVFWILLIVTVVEVLMGMYLHHSLPKAVLATAFLLMTVLKAAYIVSIFMHLGDEKKTFFWSVLMPMVLFIWFIIAFLADGSFWLHMNTDVRAGAQTEVTTP
jgi:cytochrome c oxidase subunit 4